MPIIHIIRGDTYDSFHIIECKKNHEYLQEGGELKPVLCSIPYRNCHELLFDVRDRYEKEMEKEMVDLHDLISIILVEYIKHLHFPVLL